MHRETEGEIIFFIALKNNEETITERAIFDDVNPGN
jgi:hypothetical protein